MSLPDFAPFESQFSTAVPSLELDSLAALEAGTAALRREDDRPFPETDDRGPILGHPGEAGAWDKGFMTAMILRAVHNEQADRLRGI
jgi:hypothetical protein